MTSRFLGRFAGALLCVVSCAAPAADHPDFVFILADDMGYGDLRAFNPDSKIPTPRLDRLAAEGMRFTNAYAGGPLCHPSRYALMTGQYPFRIDITRWPRHPLIAEGRCTLPSVLRGAGYHTAMVGKWHLGFKEDGYDNPLPGGPVDRGFDSFFGIRASTDIPPYFYIRDRSAVQAPTEHIEKSDASPHKEKWSPIQGHFWRAGGIAPDLKLEDVLPRFTDEAVTVVKNHAAGKSGKPLFLYLAFPAPHTPWLPSDEFRGKSPVSNYGDFVMMVDAMIGRVLDSLDATGMADNTIVIFSSDNGPVWYDRDVERFHHDSAGILRGMKGDIWEAGHRMPFIVRWPGVVKTGSTSDQVIGFVDMIATAADWTGATLPTPGAEDSFSFLPVLKGERTDSKTLQQSIVLHAPIDDLKAIRVGDWKLIDGPGSGGFTRSFVSKTKRPKRTADTKGQIYNLRTDPSEQHNLWDEKPDLVTSLSTLLEKAVTDSHTDPRSR